MRIITAHFTPAAFEFALEAAYAEATRGVGAQANLMLRRVLNMECRRAVPVGSLVEIKGAILQVRQCHIVVGVVGMPLAEGDLPWMDGLFGFVQVDKQGSPIELPKRSHQFQAGTLETTSQADRRNQDSRCNC